MSALQLIQKKRDGGEHDRAELELLVLGFTRGDVPDYQMAAWLMAVCWQGMTLREATLLTEVMAASGQQLDFRHIGRPVADKHSTGGVGDKTSLVVMPLVAACGVPVAKMSGRGLGFTGGTVDKLEAFPGIRLDLSAADFVRQLSRSGLVMSGQSADLVPADGKMYALRDVTGTVPCLPLIASSVMSKKLASGAQVIVLDVKSGSGAFMPDRDSAVELANAMVSIGQAAGRRVAAVVSDMSQPLGRAVGNALEVKEALETLAGHGPADLEAFAVELAAIIVGLATDGARERHDVEQALASGNGTAALREMVRLQGGDDAAFDDLSHLPAAPLQSVVLAETDGWIEAMDARWVAEAARILGAGREHKGQPIDLAVGVVLKAKVGDRLERGQPIAVLHARDAGQVASARRALLAGLRLTGEPTRAPQLILDRIGL